MTSQNVSNSASASAEAQASTASPQKKSSAGLKTGSARFLLLLAGMYTLQSTLGSITFQGMPAVFRQAGVEPETIGLIYLLMLPWVLKFLWAAPFEAWRYRNAQATRLVFMLGNGLAIVGLLGLTQVDPAYSFGLIFGGLTLIALVSSTVDVAIDGYAIGQSSSKGRSWVNTMQIGGGYLGSILGGGVFLILIEQISWQLALAGMALLLIILLLPAITDPHLRQLPRPSGHPSLKTALSNKTLQQGLLLVIIVQAGLRLVQGMSMPFMVDQGLSLTDLGMVATFGSSVVSLLAVAMAGYLVRRLGAWPVLIALLLVQIIIYGLFYLASTQTQLQLNHAIALLLASSGAMAASFVALYTLMMGWSNPEQAGVDFTLLQCTDSAVALVAGVTSGILVQHLGYAQYFITAVCLTLFALIALPLFNQRYGIAREATV